MIRKLIASLLVLLLPSVSFGELVFTAESQEFAVGTTGTFDLDIRVKGTGAANDVIQFYALQATLQTVSNSSGASLAIDIGQSIANTNRAGNSDYVLQANGTHVTGASPAFISGSGSSVIITDGVAIPSGALPNDPPYSAAGTSIDSVNGKLIARLRLSITGALDFGDLFRLNLSALTSTVNSFARPGPGGAISTPFFFTGAAQAVQVVTGSPNTYGGNNPAPLVSFAFGSISAVPEPSSVCLVGLAIGGLALRRRKRA